VGVGRRRTDPTARPARAARRHRSQFPANDARGWPLRSGCGRGGGGWNRPIAPGGLFGGEQVPVELSAPAQISLPMTQFSVTPPDDPGVASADGAQSYTVEHMSSRPTSPRESNDDTTPCPHL
jgi:hypothetical protein